MKFPSGAGVPEYVITAGESSLAVVSALKVFAVNPYWVLILFVSPSTGLNSWLLPPLTVALTIFPLSSLILISNEFSSAPYTNTSFLSGAGSENGISAVGAWFSLTITFLVIVFAESLPWLSTALRTSVYSPGVAVLNVVALAPLTDTNLAFTGSPTVSFASSSLSATVARVAISNASPFFTTTSLPLFVAAILGASFVAVNARRLASAASVVPGLAPPAAL